MNIYSRQDLLDAIEKEPFLTDFGIGIWHGHRKLPKEERQQILQEDREALSQRFEEFCICCKWLLLCKYRKTMNPRNTSYGLKHRVENHFGTYITNGTFIAAIIHLGIPYEIIYGSPNIKVGISMKLPPLLNNSKDN